MTLATCDVGCQAKRREQGEGEREDPVPALRAAGVLVGQRSDPDGCQERECDVQRYSRSDGPQELPHAGRPEDLAQRGNQRTCRSYQRVGVSLAASTAT